MRTSTADTWRSVVRATMPRPTTGASRRAMLWRGALASVVALAAAGCLVRAAPPPETKAEPQSVGAEAVSWQPLGSWTGTGSSQSESFIANTGAFRVRWEAVAVGPESGELRIALHSAVSGRPIVTAVDVRGAGHGESIVSDDPRVYYVQVESSNLDWRFTVEEGVFGTVRESN
jgi:hypothetical protein